MAGRRGARRPQRTARDYPRTARVNELIREILGEELERIDDDRLDVVSITGVAVDADLAKATVFFDCLDGAAGDLEAAEALESHRARLRTSVARQARLRRTPELAFMADPAVRAGERIDAVLARIEPLDDDRPADAAEG